MKKLLTLLAGLAIAVSLSMPVFAQDTQEAPAVEAAPQSAPAQETAPKASKKKHTKKHKASKKHKKATTPPPAETPGQ